MTTNLGPGVSRVLNPDGTEFVEVIWQQGRPPLDSEYNLMQELASGLSRRVMLRGTPSGWLGNETNTTGDFVTNVNWSNWFQFGRQKTGEQRAVMWANVNGWVVPVTGTRTGSPPGSPDDTDTWNKIVLDPPPANSGDFRVDFVFLEVWLARIPPNPSVLNKPSASAIWRYGNVEGGFNFIADDITDPNIGEETTQRVQVQYRMRVVKGLVGFANYPDGFDPSVVFGQGAVATPTAYTFQNMRQVLGDPGLWRAGDGSSTAQTALGTVDGYVYAIPMCAVFRRNGVVWLGDPTPNLNGGFNRNPTAVDRAGVMTFTAVPTLAVDLTSTAMTVTLVATTGLPLPLNPATPVLVKIGDELVTYSSITGTTMTLTARGVYSSRAEAHKAGSTIKAISGRPDGLFSDQIAKTDILDLRHVVNPNGFDYQALLKSNLSKLVKGNLRANWKRTGAGPQGPFNVYQDKLVGLSGSVALGVTRLDGPDNVRTVFSDAAVPQTIDIVVLPNSGTGTNPVGVSWGLALNANATQAVGGSFNSGDVITIPISQFKAGLPGGDADQVRFLNDGLSSVVTIRVDGQVDPLPSSAYTVTPTNPTSSQDLVITLNATFPALTTQQLYIQTHVQYGPGRGVARRPDSLHSIAFLNPSGDMLVRPTGVPQQYLPMHVVWTGSWSKFRSTSYKGSLPAASECYADLGSKTVAVTPFRLLPMPIEFRAIDGTNANANFASISGTAMVSTGTTTVTDVSKNFTALGVVAGDLLLATAGPQPGHYYVVTVGTTTLVLDRAVPTGAWAYTVSHTQAVMPMATKNGVAKWGTTDPLDLFSGMNDPTAATKNIYVTLPRDLVPGWGAYHVPILWADTSPFSEGINFMSLSVKGAGPYTDQDQNYVSYTSGVDSFSTLSTYNNNPIPGPATFNTAWFDTGSGKTLAGLRKFTDTRGFGRQGLELPPFYGVARLFAVYEAADYYLHGSAYNSVTRAATGSLTAAKNLLRQDVAGPTFWVEIDDDGDSTFILNADALDLTKSPNPIASFASGNYVIEASLFGFDRGSFDVTQDFRLVLNRNRSADQAADPVRANNIAGGTKNKIDGPVCILPGPLTASDSVVVTYSRTPYQGDAWGSQTSYIDIPHTPGALSSGTAYQLANTQLDQNALTRPNQKALEVLAAVSFTTSLGTGRLSAEAKTPPTYDIRDIGYEDPASFPPTSPVSARPRTLAGDFVGDPMNPESGTELLGCTERLPLGALFRDKDFRGGSFTPSSGMTFVYNGSTGENFLASLAVGSTLEQTEANVSMGTPAVGAPGDVIVHVDGEQGNYSLLVNYRTLRGGSAFTASGRYPGSEVLSVWEPVASPTGHTNLLTGTAYLVRNTVTSVGATEVSAGDELMMLIVTTVMRLRSTNAQSAYTAIGTSGTSEGYSAADLYRIEGRPILNDNVRADIDPSTIALTKRAT